MPNPHVQGYHVVAISSSKFHSEDSILLAHPEFYDAVRALSRKGAKFASWVYSMMSCARESEISPELELESIVTLESVFEVEVLNKSDKLMS